MQTQPESAHARRGLRDSLTLSPPAGVGVGENCASAVVTAMASSTTASGLEATIVVGRAVRRLRAFTARANLCNVRQLVPTVEGVSAGESASERAWRIAHGQGTPNSYMSRKSREHRERRKRKIEESESE